MPSANLFEFSAKTLKLILPIMAAFAVFASGQTVSNDSGLGDQIAAELAQVKEGTTPAAWLQAHPDEKLELFNGSQLQNDTSEWCARSVVKHSPAGGSAWTRTIYFYGPQPPKDDALPPQGTSAQEILKTTCQLGLFWIDVPEANVAAGTSLTREIEASLQSHYGTGTVPQSPNGFGSAYWVEKQQWAIGGGVLTVAYDQFQGKGKRALVRLAFPNSDAIHDVKRENRQAREDLAAQRDNLLSSVKQAGLPDGVTTDMTVLLEKHDYFAAKNLPTGSQIVAALRDLMTAAKSQSPGQQAMAFLAADRVLDFLDHNGVQLTDADRAHLKELGADYVNNELAGGPVYAHSLMKQAAAVAPPGYVSDEVLLLRMERGFDDTGMCSAGAEEFSQVIEQGQSLLAGARALPVSTLSSLHFMVGDAYSTIVWLAQSSQDDYHDPKKYQPLAESARAKGLEHYRAAFELEHGTARAQRAWKEAWRLAIGLSPTAAKYFCVYD